MVQSICPSNGQVIAEVQEGSVSDYESCIKASEDAWNIWSELPAPKRGEIVRQIGDALRTKLLPLSQLVSLEMGKQVVKLFIQYSIEFFVVYLIMNDVILLHL